MAEFIEICCFGWFSS